MAKAPRITKPGHCPGCGIKFQPETAVVRTSGGSTVCEEHDHIFIPEAIVFRGRYDESRQS